MCGIVGIVGFKDEFLLEKMCNVIEHRGPDNIGYYATDKISLGHTRLSIIDLNSAANQPMVNHNNSLRIVYNGEIYNYLSLRKELENKNVNFKTNSDCEVVLKSYETWGSDCLEKFNGMFSFAIHNLINDTIFIARDRIGIKPLYYYEKDDKILFASEIKSILQYKKINKKINEELMPDYFMYRYVPGKETFFKGINKFPPGHYGIIKKSKIQIKKYWNIKPDYNQNSYSENYFFDKFSYLLEDSVKKRLMSDVPFGMYLSGGIDSTVILSIMSNFMNKSVNTYSIDFIPPIGEGQAATNIARRFSTNHHDITITENDLQLLPEILFHLDEPQGDAIILPSYKLSQVASKDVKMVLTGEGADEILSGYQFFKVLHYSNKYSFIFKLLSLGLFFTPHLLINKISNHPGNFGNKSKDRILSIFGKNNLTYIEKLEKMIMLYSKNDTKRLIKNNFSLNDCKNNINSDYSLYKIQKHIFNDWLPNNILWRQDRMTMANSIEGRVPFLDHRLVEFAFNLPDKMKIKRMMDKYILRKYIKKKIPFYNYQKRKQPFYIPLNKYIQTDILQDYISTYISKKRILEQNFFHWNETKKIINNSKRSDFLFSKQLFSLLMFQMWYDQHFKNA